MKTAQYKPLCIQSEANQTKPNIYTLAKNFDTMCKNKNEEKEHVKKKKKKNGWKQPNKF